MADTIRAAVQTGPRQIEIREFPRPVIGPDGGGLLRDRGVRDLRQRRRAVSREPGRAVAADGARARAARDHRGGQLRGGRALGRPARRPGSGGDPHPVPVLRPVPGRALHVLPEPDRQPRRLPAARARARPVRRVRRVHPLAPELDPAQGARRHPGRGGGDVQPAGRRGALGRSPGRGGAGRHGADPRGRAARPGRGAGLARGRGRDDHRDRAGPGRRQAGAGPGVRRGRGRSTSKPRTPSRGSARSPAAWGSTWRWS